MKWIGLTGGLASGKSTVSGLLRARGYPVIDADEISKLVVQPGQPGLQAIFQNFGVDLRLADGTLDRRALGRKVFGQTAELAKLEGILHPLVQAEVAAQKRAFTNQGFRTVFYDVPLLFEKNIGGFDAVIVVSSSPEQQRLRMKSRDGLDDQEIEKRLGSQLPLAQKISQATYVINNDGDLKSLADQVDDLLLKLK